VGCQQALLTVAVAAFALSGVLLTG